MIHPQTLREIGKFVSGLVAGDLLAGIWMQSSGLLPQQFFGIWITPELAWAWMGFDVFLLLVLVHYAWHPKSLEPRTSSKSLFFAVGIITGVVAVLHFLRLAFGWELVIGGWEAPMWLSWVGVIIAAYISYASFHFANRK